jgi:hypothetical protein
VLKNTSSSYFKNANIIYNIKAANNNKDRTAGKVLYASDSLSFYHEDGDRKFL